MTPEETAAYNRLKEKLEAEDAQEFIDSFVKVQKQRKLLWPAWLLGVAVVVWVSYADWINPDHWHPWPMMAFWYVLVVFNCAVGVAPFIYFMAWVGTRANRRFIAKVETGP